MLTSKHHWFVYPFFKWYSKYMISKHFHETHTLGDTSIQSDSSVFLLSNHTSWWDGFWVLYLNQLRIKKRFHFMMLESQLRKYKMFNYAGGFSVAKKQRSVLESLRYAQTLLQNPENLVLMFPQGAIQSMHIPYISFGKGVERILSHTQKHVQVVFLVTIVDFFSQKKPSLYLYYTEYTLSDMSSLAIETKYNEFYMQCKQKHVLTNSPEA